MPEPTTQTTLGQKIDALLEPMYAEAERHRGFIKLGQAKIAELESGLAESQAALAQVEGRMVQVLQSLAAEEPVLATALGGGRLPGPAVQDAPAPSPPAAVVTDPVHQPIAAATTPEPTTPSIPASSAQPPDVSMPDLAAEPAFDVNEPELDDATAMDEISAMLAGPPEEAGAAEPTQEPVKMEDAAARAAEAADQLLADAGDAAGQ